MEFGELSMPKLLRKQLNNNGSTTLVYRSEKSIVLLTGRSPWIKDIKVVTKDKMIDQLRILRDRA